MTAEPAPRRITRLQSSRQRNAYDGRWRWWYSSIADWMLRHPGGPLTECAKELGKSYNTIQLISNSDLFKEYFARRREEWAREHDGAIRQKLTGVVEKGLDSILKVMEKKGDQIPMEDLKEVTISALDRLGFAPKSGPSVVVNNDLRNQSVQLPPAVTPAALEEARQALRLSEARQLEEPLTLPSPPPGEGVEGEEAGPREDGSDSISLDS